MRVFLTGANGWIGSLIARELLDAAHSVVGLVRSKEKGETLAAAGVTPLLGSLTDLDVLRRELKMPMELSTRHLVSTFRKSRNWRKKINAPSKRLARFLLAPSGPSS